MPLEINAGHILVVSNCASTIAPAEARAARNDVGSVNMSIEAHGNSQAINHQIKFVIRTKPSKPNPDSTSIEAITNKAV